MNTLNLSKRPKRYWIALMIIIPSFILIGGMMIIQAHTSSIVAQNLDNDLTEDETERKIKLINELNESNQTFFNILLPVFGAWVGGVVAFYFGSENLDKAQEATNTLSAMLSGKRQNITIRQLLELYPNSKDVQTVTLSDTIPYVIKKTERFKNSVVKDNGNILGVLYLHEIKGFSTKPNIKLQDVLDQIEDHLTGKKWSTTVPIKNYAELSYNDSLFEAREKMTSFGNGNHDVLGLVFENGNLEAAVNLNTLIRWFAN